MKKFFLLLVVGMITFLPSINAQSLQEIVYLKNGSVIKGVIVEQIPGVSLKIQTNDGSIFAYKMGDIEKITKEEVRMVRNNVQRNNNSHLDFGYRGFVDLGYTLGVGAAGGVDRIDLYTSHGIQIIPQLYAGLGSGVSYYFNGSGVSVPIFANIRTDILKSKATPFIDVKVGYSVVDIKGFYLSPTLGCRINHFNIGFSYVMQKLNVYGWDFGNVGGLSLKLGFEF